MLAGVGAATLPTVARGGGGEGARGGVDYNNS